MASNLIIALAIFTAPVASFAIASYAAVPVVITPAADVRVIERFVDRPAEDFKSVEVYGYVMGVTKPTSGLSRELVLARSEISKHDPTHELAFACEDTELYARSLLNLDKMVRIVGVEIERGGQKWLLVAKLGPIH